MISHTGEGIPEFEQPIDPGAELIYAAAYGDYLPPGFSILESEWVTDPASDMDVLGSESHPILTIEGQELDAVELVKLKPLTAEGKVIVTNRFTAGNGGGGLMDSFKDEKSFKIKIGET